MLLHTLLRVIFSIYLLQLWIIASANSAGALCSCMSSSIHCHTASIGG